MPGQPQVGFGRTQTNYNMSTEFVPPPFTGEITPAAPATPAAAPAAPAPPAAPFANAAPGTPPKNLVTTPDAGLAKLAAEAFKAEGQPETPPPAAPAAPAKKEAAATSDKKEAAAPAAPEAEKSALDAFADPDGMPEANKANWRKLRETAKSEINTLKNERAALAKKLETYEKATPADTARAAAAEAKLKAAEDRLAILDVRSTSAFHSQFVEPKEKALSEAKMLLADNQVADAPDMAALLSKPRAEFAKAVSELAGKLPAFDQGSLVASMREAYRLHGEEANAISKSGELKQQLESKAALAARQGFDEARTEFTSRIPEMAIPEGADEAKVSEVTAYNKARAEALAEAEKFTFGKMSEREVAGIATRAASLNLIAHHVLPAVQRDLKAATALNAQLAAELTAIKKGKNPGTFAGSPEQRAPQQAAPKRFGKAPDFSNVAAQVGMR